MSEAQNDKCERIKTQVRKCKNHKEWHTSPPRSSCHTRIQTQPTANERADLHRPDKLFRRMSNCSKRPSRPIWVGIGPGRSRRASSMKKANTFIRHACCCAFCRCSALGTRDKMLQQRSSGAFYQFPNCPHCLPVSWLLSSANSVRFSSCPSSVGIGPASSSKRKRTAKLNNRWNHGARREG